MFHKELVLSCYSNNNIITPLYIVGFLPAYDDNQNVEINITLEKKDSLGKTISTEYKNFKGVTTYDFHTDCALVFSEVNWTSDVIKIDLVNVNQSIYDDQCVIKALKTPSDNYINPENIKESTDLESIDFLTICRWLENFQDEASTDENGYMDFKHVYYELPYSNYDGIDNRVFEPTDIPEPSKNYIILRLDWSLN